MDLGLVQLISSIEDGSSLATLSIVAGGAMLTGQPVSGVNFKRFAQRHEASQLVHKRFPNRHPEGHRKYAAEQTEVDQIAASVANAYEVVAGVHGATPKGSVVNLIRVRLFVDGAGLKIASVRVPVEAVTAWWVCASEAIPTPKTGATSFVGLGFSVPL